MRKRKNLFSKLFSINMIIICVSLIIIGTFFFSMVSKYVIDNKTKAMEETALRTSEMTLFSAESGNLNANRLYTRFLDVSASNIESIIVIVNDEGIVLTASEGHRETLVGQRLKKELVQDLLLDKTVSKVLNFGLISSETMVVVSEPIKYNEQIIGAAIVLSPEPVINKIREDVLFLVLIGFFITMLFALPLLYYTSKRLSRPLIELSNATKTIAEGNFNERVSINSYEEIGVLAESFNQMTQYLENLEDMRASFVANVSHELRTPMTTIGGFIDAIMDNTIPEEKQNEYLQIVKNEINRLSRLVNDLLESSKTEYLEKFPDKINFDINEMIRVILLKFEQAINSKNINVNVIMNEGKTMVNANVDGIERVLTNLIDNSVKFCNMGGELEIVVSPKADKVKVSISNTGETISKNELNFIFDRFYKADKSRSDNNKGAGLGLFIVKNLITANDGSIDVISRDGKTTFSFYLKS